MEKRRKEAARLETQEGGPRFRLSASCRRLVSKRFSHIVYQLQGCIVEEDEIGEGNEGFLMSSERLNDLEFSLSFSLFISPFTSFSLYFSLNFSPFLSLLSPYNLRPLLSLCHCHPTLSSSAHEHLAPPIPITKPLPPAFVKPQITSLPTLLLKSPQPNPLIWLNLPTSAIQTPATKKEPA